MSELNTGRTEYLRSILKVQGDIGHAVKDASNPHFKNRYATLESVIDLVKPLCIENKLLLNFFMGKDESGDFIELIVTHIDGYTSGSKLYLIIDKNNMQAFGSAITYARRYLLVSFFNVGQEDDDGNQAAANPPPAKPLPVDQRAATLKTLVEVSKKRGWLNENVTSYVKDTFNGRQVKELSIEEIEDLTKEISKFTYQQALDAFKASKVVNSDIEDFK